MDIEKAEFTVSGGIRLLEDISLQVKPGEMVALVGTSGSGKSTLALLMAQLYDLSSGSIRYDGHAIGSLCKADISHNITMIAQHPYIFTGTVRENLLYSASSICDELCDLPVDEKIYEVIQNVGLEDDFLHFGLNMVMPKDEGSQNEQKIIQIRQLVAEYVHKKFLDDIEFFDVREFSEHSCLLDNLIIGESVNETYSIDRIIEHIGFMAILKKFVLDQELEHLGWKIEQATIDHVHQKKEGHKSLFQVSSMEAGELIFYTRLLLSLGDGKPQMTKERDALLVLALRYIPDQHTLVDLDPGIKEKIVRMRHFFLSEVIGVDMDNPLKGQALPTQFSDFRPFFPSVYIGTRSLLINIVFGQIKCGMQKSRILEKEIIACCFLLVFLTRSKNRRSILR